MTGTKPDYDVVVAGGGPAGMAAAAAFGDAGHRVLCIDPDAPVTDADHGEADLRTTALLQPSQRFLDSIGLWEALAPHATPLQVMRIVEAGVAGAEPQMTRDFDAADLSEAPFGWNLPNWLIRRVFADDLATRQRVEHRTGIAATEVFSRASAAHLRLSDGSRVTARLLVGADGRNSTTRTRAGIGVRTLRYGQKALAFAVTHDAPHGNVSTEIHRSGGPFTLVPLPDREGAPCSAVVWMDRAAEVDRLAALDPAGFSAAATARSGATYGPLTLSGERRVWPIISQIADRFAAERTALVAEAAHVLPPIGAQGMNMSLADIRVLVALVAGSDDPGAAEPLRRYARQRRAEAVLRIGGIDVLNRVSMANPRPLREARRLGLAALHGIAPVRRSLMQLGLGARG